MNQYRIQGRTYACPVQLTIHTIVGKWKTMILWHLFQEGAVRYGNLKKSIPGVTHKMFIQSLRDLESDRLVERKVYQVVPPRVEYKLSRDGARLKPVMMAMKSWGVKYKVKGGVSAKKR